MHPSDMVLVKIIIVLVLLLALGVGGYFLWRRFAPGGTPDRPTGEFEVTLTGGFAQPPVFDTQGTGSGTVTLTRDLLRWDISVQGLSSNITQAHFRTADGDAIQVLNFVNGSASGQRSLTGSTTHFHDQLTSGFIHVNVATTDHPTGEVRGAVLPVS